jgi:SAM-dependent methyltransferase
LILTPPVHSEPYSRAEAASWDSYYGGQESGKGLLYRRRLACALELLDRHLQPGGGPVADLGCGAGQLSAELLSRGFNVSAVDYSEEMLRLAGQKLAGGRHAADKVCFICADLNHYELAPAHFAAICALGCLEFLRDVPGSIARLGSGLRPGGCFLLSMPNVISPFVWPERCARWLLRLRRSQAAPAAHRPMSLARVRAVMGKSGMYFVEARFTFPATLVGGVCFPPVRLLRRIPGERAYPFAPLLANTWVALFQKMEDGFLPERIRKH